MDGLEVLTSVESVDMIRDSPQRRSSMMAFLSEVGVFEFSVSTLMLASRRAATWLFMRASSGETTMVMPWSMTAGSW